MYPVHPTDHLALTRGRIEDALEAGARRRTADAHKRFRRDQDRLQRAWTQLSEALTTASESHRRWERIRAS